MDIQNQRSKPANGFFIQIFDALATSASQQEFAQAAAEAVAEALGDWCALWLSDPIIAGLSLAGVHHRDSGKLNVTRMLAAEWFSGRRNKINRRAAGLDQPFVLAFGEEQPARELLGSDIQARLARETGTASLILIPLIQNSRRYGLFCIGSSDRQFATSDNNLAIANEMGKHITTGIAQLQKIDLARQTSQQLTFTSLRLKAILESIPQGVIVVDSIDGRPSFANSSFYRILGAPESIRYNDIPHTLLSQITFADGWQYAMDELPWIRSMRTGLPTQPEEIAIHHSDNQKVTILCSASPIRDERGSITGAVALLQDITERKEFERQKDEFLAMVAHELRTPLTALKGYTQILLRRMAKEAAPQFGEREYGMLQVLDRQVNRFSRLIFQLLDFSRIQAGRLELNPTQFSLGELARNVVAQQQFAAPDRLFRLFEEGDIDVWADQDRIEQVLTNLLSNAIKATKNGSEITIQVRREREWVKTSIADNGVGISEEAQEHLFERLYRGPGNSHEGMGLGLFICKGVIDAHEGKIWFESKLGEGSVFHFTLPPPPPRRV